VLLISIVRLLISIIVLLISVVWLVISNNRLLISYIRLVISNIRLLISKVVLLLITIVRLLISTILVMISILSLISTIGLTAGRTLILSQQTGQETCGGGWCISAPPVVAVVVVVEEGPHEKGPDHTHPQAHHRPVDRRVVGEDPGAGGLWTVLQDNGLRVLLDIAILQRDVEKERDEEVYLRQLHYSTFSLQP